MIRKLKARIGRGCFAAACALAVSSLYTNQAVAWGALAFGTSPDRASTVSASVTGKASSAEASKSALAACHDAKNGPDEARAACVVVSAFQDLCFATAGTFWAIAAKEDAARAEVIAACKGASCTLSSGCDGQAQKATPGEQVPAHRASD
jgi:hypothetical protein